MSNSDIVLYSDFNCPFCYALGERLLAAGASKRVIWRGVQHAPELPIPMASAGPRLAAELQDEVRAIRQRAPEVPISAPRGKPNTGPAIHAVAAALRLDKARAYELKDNLYREFWQQGADISAPDVLRQWAKAAGLPEELDVAGVEITVAGWQREWEMSGLGGVPSMLRRDSRPLVGLVSVEAILEFLNEDSAGG